MCRGAAAHLSPGPALQEPWSAPPEDGRAGGCLVCRSEFTGKAYYRRCCLCGARRLQHMSDRVCRGGLRHRARVGSFRGQPGPVALRGCCQLPCVVLL